MEYLFYEVCVKVVSRFKHLGDQLKKSLLRLLMVLLNEDLKTFNLPSSQLIFRHEVVNT
jgi:hypothetical protein